jgi:magnesium-transporting ATPase (P-type)
MWGRNIYGNIKKFLQFQISCNIACLVTIVLGTIFLTESPFRATSLIWINLIMDTLGALALATGPPLASIIRQPAVTGNVSILTKTVWRQIYGIALWMIVVMFLVIWFGRAMYGLDYEKDTQTSTTKCPKVDGSRPDTCKELEMVADKKTHMTMILCTFVFLNAFNLINCRVLGADEYNIFKKPFNSWILIVVLLIIFGVQWSACEWLLFLFDTAKITGE